MQIYKLGNKYNSKKYDIQIVNKNWKKYSKTMPICMTD